MPTTDINARLPASVTVTFPRKVGTLTGEVYAAPAVTLASLSLPEVGGKTGHPGSYYPRHSTRALGSGTPSNSAALATLATQFAADWYRWQIGWADLVLAGNVPWAVEGFHDVEWSNRPTDCVTRIRPAEIVRQLEETVSQAPIQEKIWARITAANYTTGWAHSWVEAVRITPTAGTYPTESGTSFNDKSGGLSGTFDLYEINRHRLPINTYVEIWQTEGDKWLCACEVDHFSAKVVAELGSGSYTVSEEYPPHIAVSNARSVSATEFNFTVSIPAETRVQVWVYKSTTNNDDDLSYWFEYTPAYYFGEGPPPDPPDNIYITQIYLDEVTNIIWFWNVVTQTWIVQGSGNTSTALCSECPHCPESTRYWIFTAAGFTGDCSIYNGNWVLSWNGCEMGNCLWIGTLGDATAILSYNGTTWTLSFDLATVTYSLTSEECCDALVLEDLDVSACSAAPATLTLSPVGSCGPCDCDCWFTGTFEADYNVGFDPDTCTFSKNTATVTVICGKIKSVTNDE